MIFLPIFIFPVCLHCPIWCDPLILREAHTAVGAMRQVQGPPVWVGLGGGVNCVCVEGRGCWMCVGVGVGCAC